MSSGCPERGISTVGGRLGAASGSGGAGFGGSTPRAWPWRELFGRCSEGPDAAGAGGADAPRRVASAGDPADGAAGGTGGVAAETSAATGRGPADGVTAAGPRAAVESSTATTTAGGSGGRREAARRASAEIPPTRPTTAANAATRRRRRGRSAIAGVTAGPRRGTAPAVARVGSASAVAVKGPAAETSGALANDAS